MARNESGYGRGYGRDYGRWSQPGSPYGGMRSDGGWGGNWQDFPGEEGWYGEGYEGMPSAGYDRGFRGGEWERGAALGRPYGREGYGADFRGGFGIDFRSPGGPYGGRARQAAYSGRDVGYTEGWDDGRGRIARDSSRGWSRTRASELMTPEPETVSPDATISEVAQKMRDLNVGIIPVVDTIENRRLRGVITDRDIAVRAVAQGMDGNAKVGDCMTETVRSVNKNDSVRDVMRIMRQEQVRRVPVIDREGRLVGIIAQADLAVDYASRDVDRELEVESTIERISEPARPERVRDRMAAGSRNQTQTQTQEQTEAGGTSGTRAGGTRAQTTKT